APGVRHHTVEVRIQGNQKFTTDQIRRRMKTRSGELLNRGVFSADILEEDRRMIDALYRSAGFEGTIVTATPEDVGHAISVLIQITEGKPYQVGAIIVAGNTQTREKLIRRDSGLESYKAYNPEKILEGQQRLYATGLFSRVEIAPLDQGPAGVRNILIQVEE